MVILFDVPTYIGVVIVGVSHSVVSPLLVLPTWGHCPSYLAAHSSLVCCPFYVTSLGHGFFYSGVFFVIALPLVSLVPCVIVLM
jgi:hypothetical protein